MNRPTLFALLFMALPALNPAATPPATRPYAVADQIDLTQILPPPPGAEETRKELDILLDIQKRRGPAEAAACVADQTISVFRFADVLGASFTPQRCPKTNALFLRVLATLHVPIEKAQKRWTRQRPPLADARIHPVGAVPANASYPSGHATAGALFGGILADLVPEQAAALHARGVLFGQRRVQAGVHYPSDIQAGTLSAAAILQALGQDPDFRSDCAIARLELREALGLKSAKAEEHDEDEEYKKTGARDAY